VNYLWSLKPLLLEKKLVGQNITKDYFTKRGYHENYLQISVIYKDIKNATLSQGAVNC
jgi:hypothetical protein